jgi:putative transposase
MLAIIGATPEGKKEIVGFTDGYCESTQSWRELLLDLKARGLAKAPALAVSDGGMGYWAALREVFQTTAEQRCWVHKITNVLNERPMTGNGDTMQELRNILTDRETHYATTLATVDMSARQLDVTISEALQVITRQGVVVANRRR